jgi:hypothetical protein
MRHERASASYANHSAICSFQIYTQARIENLNLVYEVIRMTSLLNSIVLYRLRTGRPLASRRVEMALSEEPILLSELIPVSFCTSVVVLCCRA